MRQLGAIAMGAIFVLLGTDVAFAHTPSSATEDSRPADTAIEQPSVYASLENLVTAPQIIGGEDSGDRAPWHVALLARNFEAPNPNSGDSNDTRGTDRLDHRCGGTALSSRWILTTYECVQTASEPYLRWLRTTEPGAIFDRPDWELDWDFSVLYGPNDLSDVTNDESRQIRVLISVDGPGRNVFWDDNEVLALIKLPEDLPESVVPLSLPSRPVVPSLRGQKESVSTGFTVGWGPSDYEHEFNDAGNYLGANFTYDVSLKTVDLSFERDIYCLSGGFHWLRSDSEIWEGMGEWALGQYTRWKNNSWHCVRLDYGPGLNQRCIPNWENQGAAIVSREGLVPVLSGVVDDTFLEGCNDLGRWWSWNDPFRFHLFLDSYRFVPWISSVTGISQPTGWRSQTTPEALRPARPIELEEPGFEGDWFNGCLENGLTLHIANYHPGWHYDVVASVNNMYVNDQWAPPRGDTTVRVGRPTERGLPITVTYDGEYDSAGLSVRVIASRAGFESSELNYGSSIPNTWFGWCSRSSSFQLTGMSAPTLNAALPGDRLAVSASDAELPQGVSVSRVIWERLVDGEWRRIPGQTRPTLALTNDLLAQTVRATVVASDGSEDISIATQSVAVQRLSRAPVLSAIPSRTTVPADTGVTLVATVRGEAVEAEFRIRNRSGATCQLTELENSLGVVLTSTTPGTCQVRARTELSQWSNWQSFSMTMPFDQVGAPTIRGQAAAGQTLTLRAAPATWDPRPSRVRYRWHLIDGDQTTRIGTKASLSLKSSYVGKTVRGCVLASAPFRQQATECVESDVVFPRLPQVRIRGAVEVGSTLQAAVSRVPADATLTYQWFVDGSPIAGATDSTYTVSPADRRKKIRVSVVADRDLDGKSGSLTVRSASTANVKASSLRLSQTTVSPGDRIQVRLGGFKPRSLVTVEVRSEPTEVWRGRANRNGEIVTEVEIPEDIDEGQHTVVVEGIDPNDIPRIVGRGIQLDKTGPAIVSVSPGRDGEGDIPTFAVGSSVPIEVVAVDPSGIRNVGFVIWDITDEDPTKHVQRDAVCGRENQQTLTRQGRDSTEPQTWRRNCLLDPATTLNGTYEIRVYATDGLGNNTNVNNGTVDLTTGIFQVTGGVDDRDGPAFSQVQILRGGDVSDQLKPGDELTLRFLVSDQSGIERVDYVISDITVADSPRQRTMCEEWVPPVFVERGEDGVEVWEAPCTLRTRILNGEFEIIPVAEDTLGNFTNSNQGVLDPTRGEFSVSGGSDDRDAPVIVSVLPPADSTDRFGPGDTLTISVEATDETEIDRLGFFIIFAIDDSQPSWIQREEELCGTQSLTRSGPANPGGAETWTIACVLPEAPIVGTYWIIPFGQDVFENFIPTDPFGVGAVRGQFVVG